jgi:hypothetical protein
VSVAVAAGVRACAHEGVVTGCVQRVGGASRGVGGRELVRFGGVAVPCASAPCAPAPRCAIILVTQVAFSLAPATPSSSTALQAARARPSEQRRGRRAGLAPGGPARHARGSGTTTRARWVRPPAACPSSGLSDRNSAAAGSICCSHRAASHLRARPSSRLLPQNGDDDGDEELEEHGITTTPCVEPAGPATARTRSGSAAITARSGTTGSAVKSRV